MPDGVNLVVEPCCFQCKELEERCEHRQQDKVLPGYYNLQNSKPMTLQGELFKILMIWLLTIADSNATINDWLAKHARVCPFNAWDFTEPFERW